MNLSLYIKPESLHHAYGLRGEKEKITSELIDFLESEIEIKTQGNPDFILLKFENFGIDEGRMIKEIGIIKPISKRVVVISFDFITHEAQNSLLKIFEEPILNLHFFLIFPNTASLLPTLSSRLLIFDFANSSQNNDLLSEKFLESNPGERAEILKEIIELKDRKLAYEFLNSLEASLYAKCSNNVDLRKQDIYFQEILKAKGNLMTRASSVKMILEHINSIIPNY